MHTDKHSTVWLGCSDLFLPKPEPGLYQSQCKLTNIPTVSKLYPSQCTATSAHIVARLYLFAFAQTQYCVALKSLGRNKPFTAWAGNPCLLPPRPKPVLYQSQCKLTSVPHKGRLYLFVSAQTQACFPAHLLHHFGCQIHPPGPLICCRASCHLCHAAACAASTTQPAHC